jgi:dTDP-4-dehydrorhamnose 3,5-epimerase
MDAVAPETQGWIPLALSGTWRRRITLHPDARGMFGELWRDEWTRDLAPDGVQRAMRQANLSRSDARVLRGLHLHRRQADLWVIVDGHPFVALVDVRPSLEGSGAPVVETIDASPGDALYLPAGVAHGFYARDPITLVYLVTNLYDGTDELGFAWDDPEVAVPWPDRSPILSGRDANAPSLRELVQQLREASGTTR